MLDPTSGRTTPRVPARQTPRTFSERLDMLRKFAVLTVSLGIIAGLAVAADDESPTAKIMEKVNVKHSALRKSTRTAAEFKKSGSTIPKNTEEIVKLAKEAREIKDSSEKEKKPFTEWQKLM